MLNSTVRAVARQLRGPARPIKRVCVAMATSTSSVGAGEKSGAPPTTSTPSPTLDAETSKKAAAVAMKAGSRIFQRVVTPTPALRSIGDVSTDPAAVAVEGYVQGEVKSKLLNPILMRVTRGFGIVLPGLGLWFLGRGILQGFDRVKLEYKRAGTPRAAAYSFALALGADAINMLTTGVSLLHALQEHAAFLPPDVRHPVQWYGWWASGEVRGEAAVAGAGGGRTNPA